MEKEWEIPSSFVWWRESLVASPRSRISGPAVSRHRPALSFPYFGDSTSSYFQISEQERTLNFSHTFSSTYHGRLLQREHCLQAGCHYRPSSSSYHHSHSFPFVHLIQFFFSFLLSFGVPVCLEIFGSTGKDGVGILRVLPRVLVCPSHFHMLTGVSNE